MKFNLDLAASALSNAHPQRFYEHTAILDLDRIETFGPSSRPSSGTLYLLRADEYRALDSRWAHAGCTFLSLGALEDARDGMPALAVDQSCSLNEALTALLDLRTKLDAWSEDLLRAIASGASLQDVFDVVARAFRNPIMLSDSALLFVLTAGHLPEGFTDRFWTPAIETGVCPVERYSDTWRRVSADEYLRARACLVEDQETGRHYLYRNLISEGGMHGMFELIDANVPFTDADVALVEYVADMLTLAVKRSAYQELSGLASDPLYQLIEGRPVRDRVLREGLARRGWSATDAFYVCYAVNAVELEGSDLAEQLNLTADTTLIRTAAPHPAPATPTSTPRYEIGRHVRQQLEKSYPRSCVFAVGGGCIMVVREKDRSLASMKRDFKRRALDPDDPVELLAGASSVHTDFRTLSAAYDQAKRALDWAEGPRGGLLGTTRLCFYDDIFSLDLAKRLEADRDMNWLVPESVTRLAAADEADGTAYLDTLLAYFEHGCNMNRTAEALFIHRNTLAYRIKRIVAISGIDAESPSNAEDTLRIWLACRLLKDQG